MVAWSTFQADRVVAWSTFQADRVVAWSTFQANRVVAWSTFQVYSDTILHPRNGIGLVGGN